MTRIAEKLQKAKKPSLFNIMEEIRALDDLIDEVEGDVSEGADEVLAAFFAESDLALVDKVEGYCKIIKEKEAIASARKEEAKRIAALAKVDENRAKMLKSRLYEAFGELGLKRLETATFKVSIAKNGGKRALLLLDEEKALASYGEDVRTMTSAAKQRLREDLENGDEDAAKFAKIAAQTSSIRIK